MSAAPGHFTGRSGFGPTHFAVALGGGAALAAAGVLFQSSAPIAASFTLGAITAAIAWEDWRALRVPDVLNLILLAAGIAVAVDAEGPSRALAFRILLDAAICGGALWLVRIGYRRLAGRHGLGLGDVKFAAAAAPWIGWGLFPTLVLIASLAALAFVGAATLSGGWRRGRRIAFATFLAAALAIVWLAFASH